MQNSKLLLVILVITTLLGVTLANQTCTNYNTYLKDDDNIRCETMDCRDFRVYFELCPATCNNCHRLKCEDEFTKCENTHCDNHSGNCAATCGLCNNYPITYNTRDETVEVMNEIRDRMGSNQDLHYDYDMEEIAKDFSRICVDNVAVEIENNYKKDVWNFMRVNEKEYNVNTLGFTSIIIDPSVVNNNGDFHFDEIIEIWDAEMEFFDHNNKYCDNQDCRNFHQIIKSEATGVGCAISNCENYFGQTENIKLSIVCAFNYRAEQNEVSINQEAKHCYDDDPYFCKKAGARNLCQNPRLNGMEFICQKTCDSCYEPDQERCSDSVRCRKYHDYQCGSKKNGKYNIVDRMCPSMCGLC